MAGVTMFSPDGRPRKTGAQGRVRGAVGVPADGDLADGHRLEVTFELWRAEDVLQVPDSSPVRTADAWAVYRVAGGVPAVDAGGPVRRHVRPDTRWPCRRLQEVVAYPDGQVADDVRVIARMRW